MIGIWLKALRVNQWTKNAAVMLAWFFSVADASQKELARGFGSFMMAVGMTAAFCLVSSAFYLLNDVSDYDADRLHPQKRLRPVAADLISKIAAVKAALVLFASGVLFPSLVVMIYPGRTIAFGTIMLYSVIQCFYSGFLKHIPYVDVFVIAFGFVLRAVAGAAVIDAYISRWLLVCAFTLSLFLAFSKRHLGGGVHLLYAPLGDGEPLPRACGDGGVCGVRHRALSAARVSGRGRGPPRKGPAYGQDPVDRPCGVCALRRPGRRLDALLREGRHNDTGQDRGPSEQQQLEGIDDRETCERLQDAHERQHAIGDAGFHV